MFLSKLILRLPYCIYKTRCGKQWFALSEFYGHAGQFIFSSLFHAVWIVHLIEHIDL